MSIISFSVEGKIQAKQRARILKRGGSYTPTATANYEKKIAAEFLKRHMRRADVVCPVTLAVIAYIGMPKSWSQRKKNRMEGAPHTQKPDLANIIKAVEDGLNAIAYTDDSQIYSYGNDTCKIWAKEDSLYIVLEYADGEL